jgi:predicted lipase
MNPQEALFYGKFVQAAYIMFKSNPAEPLPEPQGIPDDYELGAWIQMSDFFLDTEKSEFYGIVAHKKTDPQTRVIAIRGTEGKIEWLDDMDAVPIPFHQVPSAGRVAGGFDRIYKTLKVVKRQIPGSQGAEAADAVPETFTGSFGDQLEQLALSREAESRTEKVPGLARPLRTTVVAGHSLGGALTTLFVMENDSKRKFDITTLYTFASPRVGNLEFVHLFNNLPIESWRIVNPHDIVPKLPPHIPVVLDYEHVDVTYEVNSAGLAKGNLLCWHIMETYLHVLDHAYPLRAECVI